MGFGLNITFAFISSLMVFVLVDLLVSFNLTIPIIEMSVFLMVLQLLYAPALEFYYYADRLEDWLVLIITPSENYFAFTLPAVLFFIAGIYLPYNRRKMEKIIQTCLIRIRANTRKIENIGIALIIIGGICTALNKLVNLGGLNFIILIVSYFKFVGTFYLIACKSKYRWAAIVVVVIPITIGTIIQSVFINLIIWYAFFISFFLLDRKLSLTFKVTGFLVALFFGIVIQVSKHQYRQMVWLNKGELQGSKFETFINLTTNQINNLDWEDFNISTAQFVQRLNQGRILSYILENIPENRPYANGEFFYNELIGVLVPRFLFPDKPEVGNKDKFEYMAGWRLSNYTAMNVGVMGDGYGNFGPTGGIAFCFFFGLFISLSLRYTLKLCLKRPTLLLWLPLLFFYSMRAGNEFYIIANWIVKVGVLIAFYFFIFERSNYPTLERNKVQYQPN